MKLIEEVHSKLTILSVREWESFQAILRSLGRSGFKAIKEKAITGRRGDFLSKSVSMTIVTVMAVFFVGGVEAAEPVTTMDEVVVTATRSETNLDKVGGSSVTIITAEEIENKNINTVGEALRGVTGVDIGTNGGPGTSTTVSIRGAANKNTLVLVDGIVFNDPSLMNRNSDLANLTLDNVERIEIVRGPMSVLYGSNATSGVINIITKRGSGKPTVQAGIEGGSYNTWKVMGGASGRVDRLDYSLSASQTETDGFSIANADNDLIPHAGNTSEDDGWENTTISTKLGFEINPDFKIGAVLRYMDSMVEEDDWASGVGYGYTGDRFTFGFMLPAEPNGLKEKRTESEQLLGGVSIHNSFADRLVSSNVFLQTSSQKRNSFDNDGLGAGEYEGKSQELTWQGTLRFVKDNILTLGTGVFKEEMDSDAWGEIIDKTAETVSFWLQDQLLIGEDVDIIFGVRSDDHDMFGNELTWRVAPAYSIVETRTTIKANYATGFKAPSLYELYSPFVGNLALQAEESTGWDAGFEQVLLEDKVVVSMVYFDMKFTNRIDYDFTTSTFNQVVVDARMKGVETEFEFIPADYLKFKLGYSYNDTENPSGERLIRRPLHKAFFGVESKLTDDMVLSADMRWVGARDTIPGATDINGNPVLILEDYILVNLTANYELTPSLQLYAKVDNLFDEKYEEAWSYATPGLSGYIGIKMSH